MLRTLLKSKIHRALITDANIEYEGSISVDEDLMEAANLWHGERVLVASITKGGRFETYVITGPRGSGEVVINGGAAHVIGRGERVTIMAWSSSEKPVEPSVVLCNDRNEIVKRTGRA